MAGHEEGADYGQIGIISFAQITAAVDAEQTCRGVTHQTDYPCYVYPFGFRIG